MAKLKAFFLYTVMVAMIVAIICSSAGKWNLPTVWVYAGVLGAILITDDSSPNSEENKTETDSTAYDRDYLMVWLFFPAFIVNWIVAGLDIGRFHWSDTVSFSWQIVGFVGLVIALAFARWAVTVNRFYSGIIRLQKERGHYVINDGPYQYVRHPAYASLMLIYACSGLALGSWWSFVPMGLLFLVNLRRVFLEDRFLQENLPGYVDYTTQVPNRLVPGIW